MNLEVIEEVMPSPQDDQDFRHFGKSFRSIRSFIRDWPSGNCSWRGANSFNSNTAPSASISNQVSMNDVLADTTLPKQESRSFFSYCVNGWWCYK